MKTKIWIMLAVFAMLLVPYGCGGTKVKEIGTITQEGNIRIGETEYEPDPSAAPSESFTADLLGTVSGEGKTWRVYGNEGEEVLYVKQWEQQVVTFRIKKEKASWQSGTLSIDGKKMNYLSFGGPDSNPLVILPGLSLKPVTPSAEGIVQAYSGLAENHRIILLDQLSVLPERYTVEAMAQNVFKAMDELGVRELEVLGVSLGGMIGQVMAMQQPERIRALVLSSTAPKTGETAKAVFARWRENAEKRDLPALMKSFGETVYTPSFYEQYKDVILSSGDGATEQDYENFIRAIDAMADFDVIESLDTVHCPVFVIAAGEDHVVGTEWPEVYKEKLNCEVYIYEGCGHGVYDEAADYRDRIKAFLLKHE